MKRNELDHIDYEILKMLQKKEIMYTRFLTRKMARKLLQRQLVLQ